MIVAIVAIILIIIIGITSSGRLNISKGENLIGKILTPVEKFFYSGGRKVSNFFLSIKDVGTMKKENEDLKIKIIELEEENRSYEDLIARSDHLKNEADLIKNTEHKLVEAQVIGKEPGNWFNRFTIDKGKEDGIKKGDTVIQAIETEEKIVEEGLVGRVVEVGDTYSKVVSVIDENNKLSFKVIRTQDGGMVSGSMNNRLNGYLFDTNADIMKGDRLFTSGLGGIFEKDIYIGEIIDVEKKDDDLMKTIEVESVIDFKGVYKVFIISN